MKSTIPFDAYKGAEPFIFVSYAHKDRDSVFPLILELHGQGFRIWYDEGIDPGNEWALEIARNLKNAAQFLVFISPSSILSKNVKNEINFALNRDKAFIAVHLVETQLPDELDLRMGDIQAILKWRMSDEHFFRKLAGSLSPVLKGLTAPAPVPRADAADEKRAADEQRKRLYLVAVAAGAAAFKSRDYEAAAREARNALGLIPAGAEALALMQRLQPTLEVRALVDGRDTPGAVIGFSGKASEHRTPVTFRFETGKTYEVSVSMPAADGRVCAPASKAFVADWLGPQVWAANLEWLKLRVPPGCRAAEGAEAEPYSKSGWAQEIVHEATGMAFRFISPGAFTMGSPAEELGRSVGEVQHRVTLTQGFYLGKYPVTQAQWEKTMSFNPSAFKCADLPVERVSWDECHWFLKKLGAGARLPTEAEWEYACRAGTTTAFCYGDRLDATMANFDGNHPYGGAARGVYREKTTAVGLFKPNAWGLYDMHGNVWEWCWDCYGAYPAGAATNPQGAQKCSCRVVRGGSWNGYAFLCRSANRGSGNPADANLGIGFRAVLPLSQQ
jgi:formylglycine-generating enzyme required for sulfatase activity